MTSPFWNSTFANLLAKKNASSETPLSILGGISGSYFGDSEHLEDLPIVVFDFETTGLNVQTCKIIEIGAVKYQGRKEVARFTTLVNPQEKLPPETFSITGITDEMLVGQPIITDVLDKFHEFMRGCVGVAHNAEYDCGVLTYESARVGVRCDYTVFCTVKLARAFSGIERRNLDALAQHYGLTFESRHRSIGDILVTAQVLWRILDAQPHLTRLKDLEAFREPMNLVV